MHHVGEHHRDLLVLRMGVALRNGCTAAVTESRTLPRLGATRAARGRCGHPTLRRFRPPSFPVHQHRALDPAQKRFNRSPSAARLAREGHVSRCCPPHRRPGGPKPRCEQGRPCRPRSPGASVLRPLLAELYLREQSTQTSSALLVPCGLDADTIDSHPRAMTVSATDARGWFSGKVNCHA